MLESAYQAGLIQRIYDMLPGCLVLKNDSSYMQGIPDLVVFHKNRYAFLEVKRSSTEPFQPNQEYYLEMLNEMSYAACIFPENEEEVLSEIQRSLGARRQTRFPVR